MDKKTPREIHSTLFLASMTLGAFCLGGIASLGAVSLGNSLGNTGKVDLQKISTGTQSQIPKIEIIKPIAKTKQIHVDISKKTILLTEDDKPTKTLTILESPTPLSYFDIPSGEYKVRSIKEAHTILPEATAFPNALLLDTTYVIHESVPNARLHGIGLSKQAILELQQFAKEGMPIVVVNQRLPINQTVDFVNTSNQSAIVSSESFVVMDVLTGKVLTSKYSETMRPIASVTKLMTALVSLGVLKQENTVTLTQEAIDTYGNSGKLTTNESYKVHELIYPLLLASSNDAAEAYAEHSGRPYFIELMNTKAKELGMSATHYDDPSGLSPKNISTALDLATLTRYIYQQKPEILDITHKADYTVGSQTWKNNSEFVSKDYFIGGKSGYIPEAGKTYTGIFEVRFKSGHTRLVAISLLSSTDRVRDIETLRNYIESTTSVVYKTN